MIELIGGSLYQWDIGRKVAVTPAEGEQIPEVHFANKGDSLAIPIAVENGEAKIPDILLQTAQPVTIYAVTLVAEGCESSVYNKVLPVKAKPKPEDYYYEEATRAVSEIKKITQMAEAAGIRAANAADRANAAVENAVLCTEQELTPQQQAQVRENIDTVGSEQLDAVAAISSQGRSAKYDVLTPGWKRVLNVIRASNGMLTFGVAKAIAGARSVQALGLVFTGNANFPTVGVDTEPLIYQLYDHEAGHNNTDDTSKWARITKVRVGYPVTESEDVDGEGGFSPTNPINCYVDVYVDFEPQYEGDQVQLNVNFAGFADSHNCEAISEETDAVDVGIYGETLTYSEFEPKKDYALYAPGRSIWADKMASDTVQTNELHALNIPFTKISGTSSAPIILRDLDDGVYYPAGYGKSYADAETKSLQAGLYIVRQYTSYTAVIALLANSNHQVRWYRITEDVSDEIVYDFDNFAAAVSFNAQTLTEEQQAQVRENIGALGKRITEPVRLANSDTDAVILTGDVTTDQDDLAVDVLELKGDPEGSVDTDTVLLRGLHAGIQDTDAVNKEQLDKVENKLELAVRDVLDDSGIGDRGWTSKNIVDKLCPAFTESGSMVTCEPVEGYPLDVVTEIEPIQEGEGDPSPDNIRPITGHTGAALRRGGKNLWDFKDDVSELTYISSSGDAVTRFGYQLLLPAGTYTIHAETGENPTTEIRYLYAMRLNAAREAFGSANKLVAGTNLTAQTVMISQGDILYVYNASNNTTLSGSMASSNRLFKEEFNVQIEAGSTATPYEPYQGEEEFTVDLGQTVYGGSYDWKSGVLTLNKAGVYAKDLELELHSSYSSVFRIRLNDAKAVANGDITRAFCSIYAAIDSNTFFDSTASNDMRFVLGLNGSPILMIRDSRFATVEDFQEAVGNTCLFVYPLAVPITVQLTPKKVMALSGTNYLYSDTGNTTVTGRADPLAIISKQQATNEGILERLSALEAAIINNT